MKRTFRFWVPRLIVSVAAVFYVNLCALAQTTATLKGILTDTSGAAVAGAEVLADRQPAGPAQHATSGNDGRFVLSLVPGAHRVRVTHPSFRRVEINLTLAAGETRELSLRLELERLAATVVVTAQAEPATAEVISAPVTIVTREEIDQRQAVSLPDLLATLPGFSLGRTGREGGVASVFLNGGNSNFTKVLVDGTTVNEPGGALNFSNFTLENVEKIEVVQGAESALFGSDAVAGVIQIFTGQGTTRRPRLSLLGEGGRFSTGRGAAQLSGLLGQLDYSAAASYFQTNGQGPNDFFLNRTLSGNFGWRFTDTNTLRLALRNNTSDAGVAGQTLFVPTNLSQHNALQNFSANLGWDFKTGSHWRHHLAGAESYDRQLFLLSINPLFAVRNQINRAGFVEQSSYLFRQGVVTAGYQYEVENVWLNGPHFRRNNQAGYVDTRLQVGSRLTLNAGGRAEANDSFGTHVVPRVGAAFLLREPQGAWGPTRLRFSFGLGIKEPSLLQSFSTNPFFLGNPNLRPERSRTFSVGVEQRLASDRLRVTADYFDNRFRDLISFGSGTFFNTDLARARGVNLLVESRPAKWLRVSGSYSYDDSRVLKAPNTFDPAAIPGNRLFRRPVHSGNAILNAAFLRMNWNLVGYFTGRRADSSFLCQGECVPGVTTIPGYARFDLAGSYDLHRGLTLFGRVENLSDKQYQEALGFPAVGREYRLGMKFTIGGE